jgi:tripartite-type tricarboxylate transporter receptor subunit TctC
MNDVMGGQITFMFDTGAIPFVRGGKVRALAVASDKRIPALPDVPTTDELGVKGMHMSAWYGIAAPAGTPQPIINRVNAAVNAALASGDLTQRLNQIGADVRSGSPDMFVKFWNTELDRYAGIVKLTGAKFD